MGGVLRVAGWLCLGKSFFLVSENSFGFALLRKMHSVERESASLPMLLAVGRGGGPKPIAKKK
ncbi:MAG: hypothetical protein D3924_12680 [Candidatus Electrothrix sp. AR4]|nr:hypothetical protein [Candidatus Electrothrix sp. AR4]